MEFWIPKGYNLFHFVGGSRFIHGGAMLQEIVVPVVTVRHLKDKAAREKTRDQVRDCPGSRHKAQDHDAQAPLQLDPDGAGQRSGQADHSEGSGLLGWTNRSRASKPLALISTSPNLDDRQKQVILTLQDRQYDKKAAYRLVLRDAETGIEQQTRGRDHRRGHFG